MTPGFGEEDIGGHAPRRTRCAVLMVDMVESVRLMQQHEDATIDRWRRLVAQVRSRILPEGDGRLVKSLGDGMLLRFDGPEVALQGARAMMAWLDEANLAVPDDQAIRLRAGLHVADVLEDDLDIYGAGVNLCARLANLAQPGQIVVSAEVRDALIQQLAVDLEDMGECYLKHLAEPVRAFRVSGAGPVPIVPPSAMAALEAAVAVMPLRPRLVGAELLPAGDLLVDEVVGSLSRSPFLAVISRLSTHAVAGWKLAPPELGQRLGARYIVSGSFDCDGGQLTVQLEMAHAPTAAVLWSQRWRSSLADVLAGEDAMVAEIVTAISFTVMQRELSRSRGAPLPSLESHSLLMSSIGLIHRSASDDFARARDLLEMLAERHARLPQPNAWLGKWHVLRTVQGLGGHAEQAARQALASANRALEAGPDSALALAVKGHVHGFLLQELDTANLHLERATEVNPNEPLALIYLAALRAWQGRAAEGVPLAARALALSPADPLRYYYETLNAFVAMTAGEHQLAVEHAERSLRAHRLHLSTHRTLAIASWHLGQTQRAREVVEEMLRIDPGFSAERYRQRYPGGDGEQARRNAEVLRACGAPA